MRQSTIDELWPTSTPPNRSDAHAETWLDDFHGIVPVDAFLEFGRLCEIGHKVCMIREAPCWGHARRNHMRKLGKEPDFDAI